MHHLSPLLDLLYTLGAASWQSLWLPALLWTSVALIAVAVLRLAPALPPLWTYRFRQALLAALPVGILAAAVIDLPARALPSSSFSASPLVSTTLSGTTVTPGAVSLTWTHAVGLLTVIAAGAAGFALSKLSIQVVRTRLMTAWVREQSLDAVNGEARARLVQKTEALRSHLDVRRSAQPVFAEETDSPMLLPGRPAMVVLPRWMLDCAETDAEPPSALDMSIAHELVHLDRYDDWAALVEQLIASLAAIHPLVHLLSSDIQLSRETACDAAVLSALRCRRGSYARLLADVATRQRTVPVVALSESTSSLEKRLHAMTYPTSDAPSLFLRVVSVGVFALLIVGMVACADSPSSTQPPDEATTTEASDNNAQTVVTPEQMPSEAFTNPTLNGGMQAIAEKVSYPEAAFHENVQGRVFVAFTVSKDGTVQDVEIERGVSPELDAEAARVVKEVAFESGTMDGNPVPVRMTLPITFRLPDEG
jgi:TonB family protein